MLFVLKVCWGGRCSFWRYAEWPTNSGSMWTGRLPLLVGLLGNSTRSSNKWDIAAQQYVSVCWGGVCRLWHYRIRLIYIHLEYCKCFIGKISSVVWRCIWQTVQENELKSQKEKYCLEKNFNIHINEGKSNIPEHVQRARIIIDCVLSVWRAKGRGAWTLKRSPVSLIINYSHCFLCTHMCKSTPGHHLCSLFPSRAPQRHP